MENENQTLNPWISIWMQPRATIQQIIDNNPEHLVLVLSAIAGFSEILDRAMTKNLGDKHELHFIFAVALFVGPISGIICLYIGEVLIRWTGSWIGGRASPKNIRAAIAWSSVPLIWALILWLPEIALFGKELFTTETPNIDGSPLLTWLFFGFAAVEIFIAIWAIITFLKCIAQVQSFSVWRALSNVVLAALVVIIPIVAIILVVAM